MSWQDKIEQIKFKITTGDGKAFTPLWKTTGKTTEYNTTIYDFIDVEGSLVDRKKTKSSKHSLVFYFQGDTNTEDAAEFEASAKDPRAWEVVHPYYGTLRGQPLTIAFNEDSLNVTTVTVDFWESINADYPDSEISVKDSVRAKQVSVLQASSLVYASDVSPVTADITKIKESNQVSAAAFDPLVTNVNVAEFENAVAKSLKAADDLLSDSLGAIEAAQNVLDIPSEFEGSITDKVSAYVNVFNGLKPAENDTPTVSDKLFFEAQAGACLAGLCNALVNPSDTDYVIRTEIEEVVGILITVFNEYLTILDENQVQIYDTNNTFIPNIDTQTELYSLVSFTTGNLYTFAFEAKQERIVFTTKQTNCILLSHRYLGPSADDSNLIDFIETNNIKLNELFIIKKDREIKYFV